MNYDAFWDALRLFLLNNWSSTEIAWDFWGQSYVPKHGTAYLVPSVSGEAAGQNAKAGSTNFHRFIATLELALYVPEGTTTETSAALLDSLSALFRGKELAGIGRFRTPSLVGSGRETGWRRYYLWVRFERDEHD